MKISCAPKTGKDALNLHCVWISQELLPRPCLGFHPIKPTGHLSSLYLSLGSRDRTLFWHLELALAEYCPRQSCTVGPAEEALALAMCIVGSSGDTGL